MSSASLEGPVTVVELSRKVTLSNAACNKWLFSFKNIEDLMTWARRHRKLSEIASLYKILLVQETKRKSTESAQRRVDFQRVLEAAGE